MTCSLKSKLEQRLNDNSRYYQDYLDSNSVINLPANNAIIIHPLDETSMYSWVGVENARIAEQGFDKEMFTITQDGTDTVLHYNLQYAKDYQDYMTTYQSDLAQGTFDEQQYSENELGAEFIEDPMTDAQMYALLLQQELVETPVNFKEWKDNRELRLKSQKQKLNFYIKNKNKQGISFVNTSIAQLEKQLKDFKEDDIDVIHEKLMQEIVILKQLLDTLGTNTMSTLNSLEANNIKTRIEDLETYFNGKDLEGRIVSSTIPAMIRGKFDDVRLKEVLADISEIKNSYYDKVNTLVKQVFANNDFVQDFKNEKETLDPASERYKQLTKFFQVADKLIEDNDQKVGALEVTLGAGQVNMVMANLLIHYRDKNYAREVGATMKLAQSLRNSWVKIKDLVSNGEYVSNKLYEKDVLGVKTSNLITPYFKGFDKIRTVIKQRNRFFIYNKSADKYAEHMVYLKENVDFLRIDKLKSIHDLHKNNKYFSEFFTSSEQEMQNYEKEVRAKLGNTVFEIELKKQLQQIEDFALQSNNFLFHSANDQYNNNPFAFVENFYSNNYDKSSEKTASYQMFGYNTYFPKDEMYMNQEFKNIESKSYGKDLLDTWKNSFELVTQYINPALDGEGINVEVNQIMNQEDNLNRETVSQVSFFKKVPKVLQEMWDIYISRAIKAKSNLKELNENDILIPYSNHGRQQKEVYVTQYEKKSIEELKQLATDAGLDVSKIAGYNEKDAIKTISNSLAQLKINKTSSSNLLNSVLDATEIVRNLNARRATITTANLMKDYLKGNKTAKTTDYFNKWVQANIQGDAVSKSSTVDTKLREKELFKKVYTKAEKDLFAFLQKERTNIQGNYNFISIDPQTKEGTKYTKEGDKFYKIKDNKKEEVYAGTIETEYEKYLQQKYETMGTFATASSLLLFIKSNIQASTLTFFTPITGINNREVGRMTTMASAVAGQTKFTVNQLNRSRLFLAGTNMMKTFGYVGGNKILSKVLTRKFKNVQSSLALVQQLGLLSNTIDTYKTQGAFAGLTKTVQELKEIMTDMSTNNPEWKNQMEIVLSVLQNTMVEFKESDGTISMQPFFDGKNFIYKPGTLELRDEYRTDNNILNWQEFEESEDGNNPVVKFLLEVKAEKDGSQGNYANNDTTPLEMTTGGKVLTTFTKYLYGNTKRQYGKHDLDIVSGQADKLGLKRAMLEHGPTSIMHMIFANGGASTGMNLLLGTGAGTLAGIGAGALSVPILISAALFIAHKNGVFKMTSFGAKQEYLLALDYGKEVVLRSINTIPKKYLFTTKIKSVELENVISNLNYVPSGMTLSERKLLSANAEEVAQKFSIFLATTLAAYLVTAFMQGSDDDDEEKKQLKREVNLKVIYTIMNMGNSQMADIEKFTNPAAFKDASSSIIYFSLLQKSWKSSTKTWDKYAEGEIDGADALGEMALNTAATTGIPKSVLKLLSGKNALLSDRYYGQYTELDKYILDKLTTPEDKYQRITEAKRAYLRPLVMAKYKELAKKQNVELSEKTLKKKASEYLEVQGLTKGNGTYEDLYKSDKWNTIREEIKTIEE